MRRGIGHGVRVRFHRECVCGLAPPVRVCVALAGSTKNPAEFRQRFRAMQNQGGGGGATLKPIHSGEVLPTPSTRTQIAEIKEIAYVEPTRVDDGE